MSRGRAGCLPRTRWPRTRWRGGRRTRAVDQVAGLPRKSLPEDGGRASPARVAPASEATQAWLGGSPKRGFAAGLAGGWWLLVARWWLVAAGSWLLAPGWRCSMLLAAGCRLPAAGSFCRLLAPGSFLLASWLLAHTHLSGRRPPYPGCFCSVPEVHTSRPQVWRARADLGSSKVPIEGDPPAILRNCMV